MTRLSSRPGYIFLLSVLAIGTITTATTVTMLVLGLSAELNGRAVQQSAQAYELARACVERAILSLRADPTYLGPETYAYDYGTCALEMIGGGGFSDRTICATGYAGDSVRRVEAKIYSILPTTKIASWEDVSSFTLCP